MSEHDIMIAIAWNGLFLAILLSAVGLQRTLLRGLAMCDEWLRKWVHLLSGLCMAALPLFTKSPWVAFSIALGAGAILALMKGNIRIATLFSYLFSYRRGASWFVVAVLFSALMIAKYPGEFSLGFLILAVADPAASLSGMNFGKRQLLTKTWLGTSAFFSTTFAIFLFWKFGTAGHLSIGFLGAAGLGAALLAVVELLSTNGLDNLTVPVAAMATSSLLLSIV